MCNVLFQGLPNGSKNRISFPMAIVGEVKDKLTSFDEYYQTLGKLPVFLFYLIFSRKSTGIII